MLTVSAECTAQRVKVMLGGKPLGDSGVALLSEGQQAPTVEDEPILIGSRTSFPARSCQQVLELNPTATSGYYWVKLGISTQLHHVYCDMQHEGGGWMYWGYIGTHSTPENIFGLANTIGNGIDNSPAFPDHVIAPRSCRQILDEGNSQGDGIYQVDMYGVGQSEPVWCDMTTDGGGWTYLMHKAIGVLSSSQGMVNNAFVSGDAGSPTIEAGSDWFSVQGSESFVDWSNPLGANEIRLAGSVSGKGTVELNDLALFSVDDADNAAPCDVTSETVSAIHAFTGPVNIDAQTQTEGTCVGSVTLSQIAVREPAGIGNASSNSTISTAHHFEYDRHRRRSDQSNAVQSAFPLSQFGDSEMIMVLDGPDIAQAKTSNKYIRYRYSVDSPIFNVGPLPCAQIGGYEYSRDDQTFYSGTHSYCTSAYAYFGGPTGHLTLFGPNTGVYWGNGIGGNNSWYHSAWIYVR